MYAIESIEKVLLLLGFFSGIFLHSQKKGCLPYIRAIKLHVYTCLLRK